MSVATTNELDVAIRKETYNVACAIDAAILLVCSERIADISLCRLLETIQVAATHLRTSNPKFTCCSNWEAMALYIDDVESHIVERLANGNLLQLLLDAVSGRENGAFRRAIYIIKSVALRRDKRSQLLASC